MKKLSENLHMLTNVLTIFVMLSGIFLYFKEKEVNDAIQTQQIITMKEYVEKRFDGVEKRLDRIENKQDSHNNYPAS